MPAVNPRITITLKPEVHAILKRLSALTGNSQSAMVGSLLESSATVLERMVTVLEAAERLRSEGMQAPESIRQSLDDAQAKLEQQLGLALDVMDEGARPLLEASEKVARRTGRGAPARGRTRTERSATTPMSNRGVTTPGKTRRGKGKAAGQEG
jgi:hypothetical protein